MVKNEKQAKAVAKEEVDQDKEYTMTVINKYLKKEINVENSAEKLKHCKTISDTNKLYEEYTNQYEEFLKLVQYIRNEGLEKIKDEMINIHDYQNTMQNDDDNNIDLEGGNLVVNKTKSSNSKSKTKNKVEDETEDLEEQEDVELKEEVKPKSKPEKVKKTKKEKEVVEAVKEESESLVESKEEDKPDKVKKTKKKTEKEAVKDEVVVSEKSDKKEKTKKTNKKEEVVEVAEDKVEKFEKTKKSKKAKA
jgi:hypothetical protein